jgi:hypothetical protein
VGKGGGGGGRGNVREYLSNRLDERGDMFVGELVFRVGEIGGNVEFSDARGGRAEVERLWIEMLVSRISFVFWGWVDMFGL